MADPAPITGARRRAPVSPHAATKSSGTETQGQMLESIIAMQVTAELVDTMMLSVTLMIEDQKRLIRQEGAEQFLCDNELWRSMGVMLEAVRGYMHDIQKSAEAIEITTVGGDRLRHDPGTAPHPRRGGPA